MSVKSYDAIEMPLKAKGTAGGEQSEFADSSGPFYNMYWTKAEVEDKEIFERWQKDADGFILFSTLFSAAVAVLVAVTLPDLNGNAQERSAFFLENIYQPLAGSNVSRPPTPIEPPTSHPRHLIWVNSLWFLSLAISLTCAMLATLLQQWLRRYLAITQSPRLKPRDRGRRREFFARGVKNWHLSWWLEALPTLLHLSLFVFFAGLLILSFNVNHPVFFAIVWWIGLSGVAYLFITIMPLIWSDVPYFTPLSSIFWLSWHGKKHASKAIEKQALAIDRQALNWMLETVTEESELDKLFDTIPGFCHSNREVVKNLQSSVDDLGHNELPSVLLAFAKHTLTSNIVSQSIRIQRLVICVKAADAAHLSDPALGILKDIFPRDRNGVLQSDTIGYSLRKRDNESDTEIGLCAQSIIAGIIANVPVEGQNNWTALATDELGEALPAYFSHGKEDVLLANLVHVTRQIFQSSLGNNRDMARAASYILPSLSNFDIRNTLPGLQHDFLALWNKISNAEDDDDITTKVREDLRHLYNALGQGPGAPPTEPYMLTAEPGGQSAPTTGATATRDRGDPGPGSTSSISSASVLNRDPPSPGLHVVE